MSENTQIGEKCLMDDTNYLEERPFSELETEESEQNSEFVLEVWALGRSHADINRLLKPGGSGDA